MDGNDKLDYSALDRLADDAYAKTVQAANNARKRGVQIDDYDIEDFYNGMSAESGRSHFLPNGKVKYGVSNHTGELAVGYSQILPSTARGVDPRLDPTKELDNIELGLRYFKSLATDPIERRIRYVGGRQSAVDYYRKTGVPPDWKLYSKKPKNKETYRSYVEKGLGGKIRTGDLDALDRLGRQDTTALDKLGSQPLDYSVLDQLAATPNGDDKRKSRPVNIPYPEGVNPADIIAPAVAPETPQTQEIQRQAAADLNVKSRIAVLLNPKETPDARDPKWKGFQAFKYDDSRFIMVNTAQAKKKGLKDAGHIQSYLDKNKAAANKEFLGIVDSVDNTGGGQPVVTAQVDGKEAASAVVTDEESAQRQAANYADQFPNADIGVTTTDDVVNQRQTSARTQSDINAEFDAWIAANGLPRDNTSVAKFHALKQAEVDDKNAKITADNNAIGVANDIDDLTVIAKAAQKGQSGADALKRQAEIQKRFDDEKLRNPALTTDEFNATLQAENEAATEKSNAEWLAKTPKDYSAFAAKNNLDPYADETIKAYNAQLKVQGRGQAGVSRRTETQKTAAPALGKQFVVSESVIGDVDLDEQGNPIQPQGEQLQAVPKGREDDVLAKRFPLPKGLTKEQASEYGRKEVEREYGVRPPEDAFIENYEQGITKNVTVTFGDLRAWGWKDADTELSRRKAQQRTEQPKVDLGLKTPSRLNEFDSEKALEDRIKQADYSAQQIASDAISNLSPLPWQSSAPEFGRALGTWWFGDKMPEPSAESVEQEKQRLLNQYGSYAKAYDAEKYYQEMTWGETAVRAARQTAGSFAKNLVSGTGKSIAFVGQLAEDVNPVNALLPDEAKIGVRNAVNVADFLVRLMQTDSKTAWKETDWAKSNDVSKQQMFRAMQEFDKAIGDDPVLKHRFLGSLSDAGGSVLAFVALGALMPSMQLGKFAMGRAALQKGLGRTAAKLAVKAGGLPLETAVAGAAQMAGTGYEEGNRSDLTESQAKAYGVIQGLLGTTEMVGAGAELAQLLKAAPTLRRQVASALLETARVVKREGKQEFAQEVLQTTSGKVVMAYLKDTDPSTLTKLANALNRLPKQLAETVSNEGLIALITGGAMGGATAAASVSQTPKASPPAAQAKDVLPTDENVARATSPKVELPLVSSEQNAAKAEEARIRKAEESTNSTINGSGGGVESTEEVNRAEGKTHYEVNEKGTSATNIGIKVDPANPANSIAIVDNTTGEITRWQGHALSEQQIAKVREIHSNLQKPEVKVGTYDLGTADDTSLADIGKELNESVDPTAEAEKAGETQKAVSDKLPIGYDNPGGDWLESQRTRAEESEKKVSGAVTAYLKEIVELPVDEVAKLKGYEDEHLLPDILTDDKAKRITESIKKEGVKEPVFIQVNHRGEPILNEGNHRVAIAKNLGQKTIPVEIRWYAGGEKVAKNWSPASVEEQMFEAQRLKGLRDQLLASVSQTPANETSPTPAITSSVPPVTSEGEAVKGRGLRRREVSSVKDTIATLPTSEQVSISANPTARETRASVAKEKVNPRTGLTETQTEFLAKELRDAAYKGLKLTDTDAFVKEFGEGGMSIKNSAYNNSLEMPDYIKVPGDGNFKVYNVGAANTLHQKITGKPIPGLAKSPFGTVPRLNSERLNAAMKPPSLGKPSKETIAQIEIEQEANERLAKKGLSGDQRADYDTYGVKPEVWREYQKQAKAADDTALFEQYDKISDKSYYAKDDTARRAAIEQELEDRGLGRPDDLAHKRQPTAAMESVVDRYADDLLTNAQYTVDGSMIQATNLETYGVMNQVLDEAFGVEHFFGRMLQPAEVTKVRQVLTDFADEMAKGNYSKEGRRGLAQFRKAFDKAAKVSKDAHGKETVIFIVDPIAIPEEQVHQETVLAAVNNDIKAMHSPKFYKQIHDSELFKKSDIKETYKGRSKEIQAIEFVHKILAGSFAELNIDPVKDADAVYEIVRDWHDDFVAVNGEFDRSQYERIFTATNYWFEKGKEISGKASERDAVDETKAKEPERKRDTEKPPDEAAATPDVKQRVMAISRHLGQNIYYDPQSHVQTEVKAEQLIDRKGVDRAIYDALEGRPSAEGMKVVYDEFARQNALYDYFKKNNQQAEATAAAQELADLAARIGLRQINTGREIEIAKTFDALSPDIALLTAQRLITLKYGDGATLTQQQIDATKDIAKVRQELEVKLEEANRRLQESEAEIRRLADEKQPRRPATTQEQLLKEYQKNKKQIIHKLEELFPDSPLFNGASAALEMAAERADFETDLDPEKQAVVTQYATGQILEGLPYEPLIDTLEQLGLSRADAQQIHADAIDIIRPARKPRTEAAKEQAKIRAEHYRQAKAFEGKGQPQLSGIAQDAQADPLYKDNEVLIKAIDYLTNVNIGKAGRSLNGLINGIREGNDLSMTEAEELAARARRAVADLKAKRQSARDKQKGVSEAERQNISQLTVQKRNAAKRMNEHLRQLGEGTQYLVKRFNNLMRGLFVNNYATQLFNAVQSTTVSTPSEMALDGIALTMKNAFGLDIGENQDVQAEDLILPLAYIFSNNKQVATQSLAMFPEQYFRIHAGILGDIEIDKVAQADTAHWLTKPLHKVFDKADKGLTKLSHITGAKMQEMHFRNAIIAARFDQLIRARSKGSETLESALKDGTFLKYVTEKDATKAADDALEVTFASEINDPVGKVMKRVYDQMDNFLPIFLNPVTYARFTYTVTKGMVLNPLAFGAFDTQAAGGRGYNTKSIAKGVLAYSGVLTAYALQAALGGDDDRWDTLYINGKDQPPLSVKRFFPLSSYFYVAHLIRQYKEGGTLPTKSDLAEGFASLETDYFMYGAAVGLYDETGKWITGSGSPEEVGQASARMLGNFFSGALRFFVPLKMAASVIDEEERTLRDDSESAKDKFLGELSRSLPGVIRASDAKKKIDPVTEQPILQPFPAGRAVGLNFVHPSFLSNKDTAATQWAGKYFSYKGNTNDRFTADQRNAYFVKKRLREAVRRGTITGDDASDKAKRFLATTLNPQAMGRLQDELKLSELQTYVKYGFGMNPKDIKALRVVWEKATDQEKDELRVILQKKENLTPEFREEFGVSGAAKSKKAAPKPTFKAPKLGANPMR